MLCLRAGVFNEPLSDLMKVLASLVDAENRILVPGFLDKVRLVTHFCNTKEVQHSLSCRTWKSSTTQLQSFSHTDTRHLKRLLTEGGCMHVQVRPNTLEPALVRLKSSGEFSLEGYRAALGIPQLVPYPLPQLACAALDLRHTKYSSSIGVCAPQCLGMSAMATASLSSHCSASWSAGEGAEHL